MQSVKRVSAATLFTGFSFGSVCYWSHYILRPIFQFQNDINVYFVGVLNLIYPMVKTVDVLKTVHSHICNAELSLSEMYSLELGSYTELKELLGDLLNLVKARHQTALIDFTPMSSALTTTEIFGSTFFKKPYSPYFTLGTLTAAITLVVGLGITFFNDKMIVETITPTDVEDLVSAAVKQESKPAEKTMWISSIPFKTILFGSMVVSVGAYFFKDLLKNPVIDFAKEISWRKI